jgi:RNA polymerase sigma factor (sigma-70 family)
VLGHLHDAEDAFQAAFLLLARKAGSVLKREALSGWLYRVAYRTALEAKAKASRRRAWERQVDEMPQLEVAPAEPQDWRPLLDRELDMLPEKFRTAVVLCDLEGKTRREAARQLGLSEGTLSSRLARARCLLARRLTRQGLTLSGGALAAALAEGASASVPAPWVNATVKAAASLAAGRAAAVATPAAALMNEVLKAMLMTKLKLAVAGMMVAMTLGASGLVYRSAGHAMAAEGQAAPSELEALRRKVELLQVNLDVVLEKVRAQEAELRTLRGRAAAANKAKSADLIEGGDKVFVEAVLDASKDVLLDKEAVIELKVEALNALANPVPDVEAALKALRKNPNDSAARRRAAHALEQALNKLREHPKPTE